MVSTYPAPAQRFAGANHTAIFREGSRKRLTSVEIEMRLALEAKDFVVIARSSLMRNSPS